MKINVWLKHRKVNGSDLYFVQSFIDSLNGVEIRAAMADFTLNSPANSSAAGASLVQMSYTSINAADLPMTSASSEAEPITESSTTSDVFPTVQSELEFPTSYLHRLNFFATTPADSKEIIFSQNPRFPCLACCRRDEIERHYKIHETIDCVLGTTVIEQCPKVQYGCTVRWQRLEPVQKTGEPIRIRFDRRNDAIAFEWYPEANADERQTKFLMDLPTEVLTEILRHVDSLSLRNLSLVCRVSHSVGDLQHRC